MISSSTLGAFSVPRQTEPNTRGVSASAAVSATEPQRQEERRSAQAAPPPAASDPLSRRGALLDLLA